MSEACDDLYLFVDGELDEDRARAFRAHLATCEACQSEHVEAVQLCARLRGLPARPQPEPEVVNAAPTFPPTGPTIALWKQAVRWTAAPVAAGLLGLMLVIQPDSPPRTPSDAFASLKTRPHEVRFAYGAAADYRPRREQMLGGSESPERIPHAKLTELERSDRHALALAMVWNGDSLRAAAEQLGNLAPTESVRSDRAAIEILSTSKDNLESVLTDLEALQRGSDPTSARAARWNYALLLAQLGLPLSAAQAFRAIADEHEPGWEDEARRIAAREGDPATKLRDDWMRAAAAGEALRRTGEPVPADLIDAAPGVLRARFYNAVRTAPTAARVRALAPLAAELDELAGTHVLSDYVERVAKLDFRRRAPLAAAYAQLLDGKEVTGKLGDQLVTPTTSPEIMDIVLGAMVEVDVVATNLGGARAMVKETGDPWFEIVLARAEAAADISRNDWFAAEGRLKRAEKQCTPAVMYQCLALAHDLGGLYKDLHRVRDALDVLQKAVGQARSAGEWVKLRQLLGDLADAERFHTSTATARAHANEVLLMIDPDDCESRAVIHRMLTGAALLDVNSAAARRHFEETLRCGPPHLTTANCLADIGRLDARPGDLERLQGWLSTLRTGGKLTPAELAFADEIEGRLLIERDRPAGRALLERAIAATRALPHDVLAEKVRAGAYSMLILDAARGDASARALGLIAESLDLAPPGNCVVGVHAEDERAVVIVRGADGGDVAVYDSRRSARSGAPVVPPHLTDRLTGCSQVSVLALASLQGQPNLLPMTLPWSYVTGAHRGEPGVKAAVDSPVIAGSSPSSVIVNDVTPPPELDLPKLSTRSVAPAPSTRVLSGSSATPTRVLSAMRDAREIQFHTHALVDMGISDASHLVLSPDPDGKYALTAESIHGATLRGAPIVVLAACRAAQGARYQHAPWSLPHAFLSAGARAVFAAATEIPDIQAGLFFARVLQRVRDGAAPAAALREERVAALARGQHWAASVMLFE